MIGSALFASEYYRSGRTTVTRFHARFPGKNRKIKAVKVRDVIRLIEADGWKHVRTTGSHRHYKHDSKPNVVTVPGHPGDDVPTGTLKSVLKAAGLEKR